MLARHGTNPQNVPMNLPPTGDPPPPTPSPPDRTAHSQARLALITAAVALVSVIAGPLVSLRINSDQIAKQRVIADSAAHLEQDNYLRTQRRTAYSDFSAAGLAFVQSSATLRGPGVSAADIRVDLVAAAATLSTVNTAFYSLTLIGSPEAVGKATAVVQQTVQTHQALANQSAAYRDDAVTTDGYRALGAAVDSAYSRAVEEHAAFIDLARADVHANDSAATTGTR